MIFLITITILFILCGGVSCFMSGSGATADSWTGKKSAGKEACFLIIGMTCLVWSMVLLGAINDYAYKNGQIDCITKGSSYKLRTNSNYTVEWVKKNEVKH